MSAIDNFVKDYPMRCGDLLREFWGKSNDIEREVTLLLTVAGSGIVVPYERLDIKHPIKDSNRYRLALTSFKNLLKKKFINSDLWEKHPNSWRYGKDTYQANQSFLNSLHCKSNVVSGESVKNVLSVIRHSLAHGNILTEGDPIQTIYLMNIHKGICRYLIVSPDDFYTFLNNWFNFISELEIPSDLIEDGKAAA